MADVSTWYDALDNNSEPTVANMQSAPKDKRSLEAASNAARFTHGGINQRGTHEQTTTPKDGVDDNAFPAWMRNRCAVASLCVFVLTVCWSFRTKE
jgi:hypothetical protein